MRTIYASLFILCYFFSSGIQETRACIVEGDFLFFTQPQLDTFLINLSCPLDTIDGNLSIEGSVTDLRGLLGLKHISGALKIVFSELSVLHGLDSLESIGHGLYAFGDYLDFDGLEKLHSIGATPDLNLGLTPALYIDLDKAITDSIVGLRNLNGHEANLKGITSTIFLERVRNAHSVYINAGQLETIKNWSFLDSLATLRITNNDLLTSIRLPSLKYINTLDVSACDSLEQLILGDTLRFIKARSPIGLINFKASATLSSINITELNGVWLSDTLLTQMDFTILRAPQLVILPDIDSLNIRSLILQNVGLENTLDLGNYRNTLGWDQSSTRPLQSISSCPSLDSIILGPTGGDVAIEFNRKLKFIGSHNQTHNYFNIEILDNEELNEVSIFKDLIRISPMGRLRVENLPNFSFSERDLSLLEEAGAIQFVNLPSNIFIPSMESLQRVSILNYVNVATQETSFTIMPNGGNISHFFAWENHTPNLNTLQLHIGATGDTLGNSDQILFPSQRNTGRSSELRRAAGFLFAGDYENLSVTGLSEYKFINGLYLGRTNPNIDLDAALRLLPDVTSADKLYFADSDATRLWVPPNLSSLYSIGIDTFSFRAYGKLSLTLKNLPNLSDVSSICPVINSGSISTLYFEENVPSEFNTEQKLRTYCDNLVSSQEHSDVEGLILYPTILKPGASITIRSMSKVLDQNLKLVSAQGVVVQKDIFQGRTGVHQFTLLNTLPPGIYFLHISTRDGRLTQSRKLIVQ